ncbi:cytochrome c [Ahrensia sp. R2A130]|uniref:c-type cytochrome n=1 Tax=Ahrensia sp. R2A130 TaxID=744979 RepID=UPI00058D0D5B|nr:cytochrome c [Ahrensia sp. R2A130]
MKKLFVVVGILGVSAAATGWWLSSPKQASASYIMSVEAAFAQPDLANGELVFWAGGCASCHKAQPTGSEKPVTTEKSGPPVLAGGLGLETQFGTFVAPNISSDVDSGLGSWTASQFATAMVKGVSPSGRHYYPAFPYTSYTNMTERDVADLFAFLKTLPASTEKSKPHELGFPFSISRGMGLWKLLYLKQGPVIEVAGDDPVLLRGRYLTETLGHCGECHTPRNALGGWNRQEWFAGAIGAEPREEGPEIIPNITPHADGIESWSESDIDYALESGFTPDFDSLGSSMADVVANMARLPASDREAIAAYLKQVVPSRKNVISN